MAQSKNQKQSATSLYRTLFQFVYQDDLELGNCNADVLESKHSDIINPFYGKNFKIHIYF